MMVSQVLCDFLKFGCVGVIGNGQLETYARNLHFLVKSTCQYIVLGIL